MLLWAVLISTPWLTAGGGSGMRGPHHPRGHYHYSPTNMDGHSITHDNDLTRDIEHIKEDLEEWGMAKEQAQNLTPEEMDFHYFKLHDYDKNTKLDGLEILQAIQHTLHKETEDAESSHEGSGGHSHHQERAEQDNFPFFVELIDQVLAEDDKDNDGYLSYIEYVVGRQKEQTKQQRRNKHSHG